MLDDHKTPKYFAWLKTIKVGDELPFRRGSFADSDRWSMSTVTRITPKSTFVGSWKYDRETGRGVSLGIRFYNLQSMTAAIRAEMTEASNRQRAMSRIEHESDTRFRNVTTDKLMAMAAILGPTEKDSQ